MSYWENLLSYRGKLGRTPTNVGKNQRQVEGDQAPKQTLLAIVRSQKCKELQKGKCDNLWCFYFSAITKGSSLYLIPPVQTSLRRD